MPRDIIRTYCGDSPIFKPTTTTTQTTISPKQSTVFKTTPTTNGDSIVPNIVPPYSNMVLYDLHRAQQFYDYAARLKFSVPPHTINNFSNSQADFTQALLALNRNDPRLRFVREEPKPSYSYIGLIAMAILSSPDKKLVLSDIYQWILDNYSYFRQRGPVFMYVLKEFLFYLSDCFVKAGRSANGKGHYWAIHPANAEDFSNGDFRRRRAQRRVRKSMGLAIQDEEDEEEDILQTNETESVYNAHEHSPTKLDADDLCSSHLKDHSPSSTTSTVLNRYFNDMRRSDINNHTQVFFTPPSALDNRSLINSRVSPFLSSAPGSTSVSYYLNMLSPIIRHNPSVTMSSTLTSSPPIAVPKNTRKRCFDIDNLLAPDPKRLKLLTEQTERLTKVNKEDENDDNYIKNNSDEHAEHSYVQNLKETSPNKQHVNNDRNSPIMSPYSINSKSDRSHSTDDSNLEPGNTDIIATASHNLTSLSSRYIDFVEFSCKS
ncbi:unnamed protein product [Didymodactylos carnosus]|uniref:Fork-head domain-containing protein n=1 Tax=Didymodactylos carnosus TaxID=1234261 RepID=A0A813X9D5_9BILA|nr:unnamed protein product [Didymodactylos carnosus]CAF0866605.1 unnamed protein product [Didymodactylos carnosus]CAF3542766.1 unnamed protein product [Didymodactylos carnosus]CAF3654084.1 unnamed protein product [Didymodactylos carnosus]